MLVDYQAQQKKNCSVKAMDEAPEYVIRHLKPVVILQGKV